ncbi:hypothetical protein J5500_05005 [Candidatus Saccharibacteria bacterium]|nr:hypothetical protein [Candidatus Saccharibacteria bacterium]
MEERKKRTKRVPELSGSPNIKSATGEPIVFEEPIDEPEDSTYSAVDGVPIDEENIEFHAKDIKKKDDSKLFVKVEGAQKIARKKERDAKKKDDELIKRLQAAANKRKQEYKDAENEKKAAKRKASKWIRNYKTKKVAKQIWRFRFFIGAIVIALAAYLVIENVIIPNKIAHDEAGQRAAAREIIASSKTEMLKIFEQIVGKEMGEKDLREITKKSSVKIATELTNTEGMLYYEDGGTEVIQFEVEKNKWGLSVKNFKFLNQINGQNIQLYESGNIYYYSKEADLKMYPNLEELINGYILSNNNEG